MFEFWGIWEPERPLTSSSPRLRPKTLHLPIGVERSPGTCIVILELQQGLYLLTSAFYLVVGKQIPGEWTNWRQGNLGVGKVTAARWSQRP